MDASVKTTMLHYTGVFMQRASRVRSRPEINALLVGLKA